MTRPARALWNDYLFLTREMEKFLTLKNLDMFYELMRQRDQVQTMIDEKDDAGFLASDEAKPMFAQIHTKNESMAKQLRLLLNNGKKHQVISQAYNYTKARPLVGGRLNQRG